MFTGLFEPAFLQAACAHATPTPPPEPEPDGIVIRTNVQGAINPNIICTGTITIKSTYNGQAVEAQYSNLDGEETTAINTDANTDIIITGNVTSFSLSPMHKDKIVSFRALNSNITYIAIGYQSNLLTLCVPAATSTLSITSPTALTKIMYPANNSSVSNTIQGSIQSATAADGVVYLDEDGDYYDTIANAATAKGWTVEQLPA